MFQMIRTLIKKVVQTRSDLQLLDLADRFSVDPVSIFHSLNSVQMMSPGGVVEVQVDNSYTHCNLSN